MLSLFVIYAVDVRHLSKWGTGAVMAWEAVLGIAIAPYYGTLVDRFGPSKVLAISMPASALGLAAIGWASTLPMLAVVATFFAIINAGGWSAFSTLMTRIVRDEHRQNAFGLNFLLLNAGIGVGIVVGTQIASTSDLHSFQLVYAMAGTLQLASAVTWFTLRRHGGPPAIPEHGRASDGWREVLQDRRLVRLTVTGLLVMICGYGSVEAGLPYFVTNVAHLSDPRPRDRVRRERPHDRDRPGLHARVRAGAEPVARARHGGPAVGRLVALRDGLALRGHGGCHRRAVRGPARVRHRRDDLAGGAARARERAGPRAPPRAVQLAAGHGLGGGSAVGQLMALLFAQFNAGLAWTLVVAAGAIVGGIGITSLRRVLTAEEDGRTVATSSAPVSS